MRYEFFICWRYMYQGRRSAAIWVGLGLAFFSLGLGAGLFFVAQLKAVGAALMLVGGLGVAASAMLALFTPFTAFSILGVAIGVSILIAVLSVTSGFQHEFRRKVLGVNAHILVLKYGIDFVEYRKVIRTAEKTPGVAAAAPFLFNEMMIAKGTRLSGTLVKGVDPIKVGRVLDLPTHIEKPKNVDAAKMARLLTSSRDERGAPLDATPGVIIGRELARKLGADVGDPVRLISPLAGMDLAGWSANSEIPRSRDFRVAAIFYSGFEEYDKRLIFVHMREVQQFFDQGDVVTGVELKVNEVYAAPQIAKALGKALGGSPYRTIDWSELNHNLFTALQIQKIFLAIVIGIIVIVAAFNVLAALAMLVIRKTREIAILNSMGMSRGAVARIFRTSGTIVWLAGTSLGLLWGYLGCLVLRRYGFPLDPKIYLISELPVEMNPVEFIVTALFAYVVCYLATLYPAYRAARLDPVVGLRYE